MARTLFESATVTGAQAVGVEAGRIAPGCWADFAAVDLDAPALAGWEPDTLVDSLVFGASDEVVAATCVGGRWVDHRQPSEGTSLNGRSLPNR